MEPNPTQDPLRDVRDMVLPTRGIRTQKCLSTNFHPHDLEVTPGSIISSTPSCGERFQAERCWWSKKLSAGMRASLWTAKYLQGEPQRHELDSHYLPADGRSPHPHFTDEDMKAQRGWVMFSKMTHIMMKEMELTPKATWLLSHVCTQGNTDIRGLCHFHKVELKQAVWQSGNKVCSEARPYHFKS